MDLIEGIKTCDRPLNPDIPKYQLWEMDLIEGIKTKYLPSIQKGRPKRRVMRNGPDRRD